MSNLKQPSRIVRYNPNLARMTAASAAAAAAAPSGDAAASDAAAAAAAADEPPMDWMALLSLLLGVAGLLLKIKLAAWLALFCCLSSVASMKRKDRDFKQILSSVLFAVMGLIMAYFGVKPPPGGAGATAAANAGGGLLSSWF
jgi:hypothetical protein